MNLRVPVGQGEGGHAPERDSDDGSKTTLLVDIPDRRKNMVPLRCSSLGIM